MSGKTRVSDCTSCTVLISGINQLNCQSSLWLTFFFSVGQQLVVYNSVGPEQVLPSVSVLRVFYTIHNWTTKRGSKDINWLKMLRLKKPLFDLCTTADTCWFMIENPWCLFHWNHVHPIMIYTANLYFLMPFFLMKILNWYFYFYWIY